MDLNFIDFSDKTYLEKKVYAHLQVIRKEERPSEREIQYIVSTIYKISMDSRMTHGIAKDCNLLYKEPEKVTKFLREVPWLVTRSFPLVDNEFILHDTVSFLLESYSDYPAGTALLIRTTNKSIMVHFFPSYQLRNCKLETVLPVTQLISASDTPEIPELIKDLFSGLLKGLLNIAGAAVFDLAFPKNVKDLDDLFVKVEDSTRNIVREELAAAILLSIENGIKSIVRFIQVEYTPRKEEPNITRKDLFEMLISKDQEMWQIMGNLVSKDYRSKGITHLVTGANSHLAILQELALIDPVQLNPNNSSFMVTYYARLEDYIDALSKAKDEVYQTRLSFLGEIKDDTPLWSTRLKCIYTDAWANKTFEFWDQDFQPSGLERAKQSRELYKNNQFIPKIIRDLEPYEQTKKSWIDMRKK